MNRELFIKIIKTVKEDTQEPCILGVSSVHASCDCDEKPTIYFNEITKEDAYTFIHTHAAHNDAD